MVVWWYRGMVVWWYGGMVGVLPTGVGRRRRGRGGEKEEE